MTPRKPSPAQQPSDTRQRPSTKPAASPASDSAAIIADSPFAWIAKLAKRLLAHSLNMPEPLLHDTGAFVFAHVAAAENRAIKTLCPFTLLRQFLARSSNRDF